MIDAQKMEIAENLHRSELTYAERADHINEWRRLTEKQIAEAPEEDEEASDKVNPVESVSSSR